MAPVFDVDVRGIGKPDYTREVSSARQRGGLSLKYTQSLVVFGLICTDTVAHPYAIPWVQDQIAVGGNAHIINVATGLPTPYNVPQGYSLNMVQKSYSGDQDYEVQLEYQPTSGGPQYLVVVPGIVAGGEFVYANMVVPYNTATLDPTASSDHDIDFIVYNRGLGALNVNMTAVCILEELGSPPLPTTKNCRCPFCGGITNVPVGTCLIKCSKCGMDFIVQDFTRVREL